MPSEIEQHVVDNTVRPLIIFHDQCMDGLVAAYIAWRHYGDKAEYVSARYGDMPPDVCGRDVYVLDFCYDPATTQSIAECANKLVVLDHHATAVAAFRGAEFHADNTTMIFDMNHSGAWLSEKYFNGAAPLWIVEYAEDRDLWKFALPHSREVNAYLAAAVMGRPLFEAFERLNEVRGMAMKDVVTAGIGAQLQIEAYVRQVCTEAVLVTFADHKNIPMVNCAKPMVSDVLNKLAENHLFAVGWRAEGKELAVLSLRSKGYDVRAVAERFGGGGHPKASGITLSLDEVKYILEKS